MIKFCDDLKVFKVVRMRIDYEGWQKDFTGQGNKMADELQQ